MKAAIGGIAALALLAGAAGATGAYAQDTTVVHKESANGDRSKTVVRHDNGAKTVIKRHGNHVKKVHTSANGDRTVVKKTTTPP
jgi:hypothetical protein